MQKETVESQKASITVSETKMAEMRRTMKIAMQRIQDMKSINMTGFTKTVKCIYPIFSF